MKMSRRSFGKLALAAGAASFGVPYIGRAAEPIVIKFSHVVAPDTPKGRGADKFKELAEKYTAGAVKVEVYPNSQLYKDKEELEALQLGAVQLLCPSLSKFGPLGINKFESFDLPYMFADRTALAKITKGAIGAEMMATLAPKGIAGLGFWDNGFKVMSANSPLHVPDDFLGLKMRIQSSKVLEAEMKALGAVPQVMAFSEVYQALQTGVVDGTENPPSNMLTQKMNEVQKHATLSYHGYLGYAAIANKAFWDGLPAEIRKEVDKAMAEATDYNNEIAAADNKAATETMMKAGTTQFHEQTADERAAWIKVLMPVHAEMSERIGKDLVDRMHKELGIG